LELADHVAFATLYLSDKQVRLQIFTTFIIFHITLILYMRSHSRLKVIFHTYFNVWNHLILLSVDFIC